MTQHAAIFDMDGTLVDNNPYHYQSWQVLFERHGLPPLSLQTFNESMSGVPGMVILRNFFGDRDEQELEALYHEKDAIYYDAYRPYMAPINGLERLLSELKDAGWKLAMASSAAQRNIDFILNTVAIKPYFDAIINGTRVHQPKPNPQIFLKAADELQVAPGNCVVFEDSISGVKAANSAGMKVVAITTTHKAHELHPVNLMINDYAGLKVLQLEALFEKDTI
ncbi:beta-phosphoglucomutase family hydrolase [Mucilaginibacter koreensis]